jgi:hypothetical protein
MSTSSRTGAKRRRRWSGSPGSSSSAWPAPAGALALLVILLGTQQLSTSGELADLNSRMQQLTPTLERIKEFETETAELSPKVDTLQTPGTPPCAGVP